MHIRTLPTLALALLLLTGCKGDSSSTTAAPGPEQLEPTTCGSVQPLHALGEIYLAGQPSVEDFKLFKAKGVKTIINLRHNAETPDMDESKVVQDQGMAYIHLPWSGNDQLTNARLDHMRRVLAAAERPLLLHCASANRVGAGWLAYRALDEGIALEDAIAEARTVGLRTKQYEDKAIEYVQRLLKAEEIKANKSQK